MDDELRRLLQQRTEGTLPGWFGLQFVDAGAGHLQARLALRSEHMAPNGYLHAGTVVTLADTCCGLGCGLTLPEGATGFTTIELKSNFLRTAKADDTLACEARAIHGGRTTQVWDAEVTRESDGRALAIFRCTQLVLRPPSG